MTTHELLELASLDALGLLDEQERRAFDEAFAAAPRAVQDMVRREQARFVDLESTLPLVTPPSSLRQRVLDAVQSAVRAARSRRDEAILATLRPSRGVSPLWRAAAIGCAAASVVFAVSTIQMRGQFDTLSEAVGKNGYLDAVTKEFGVRFADSMYDAQTQLVQFVPGAIDAGQAAPVRCQAFLVIDREQRAQFFCRNLPSTAKTYSLVVIDPSGVAREALLTFTSDGSITPPRDIARLALDPGATLAVVAGPVEMQRPVAPLLRSVNL